MKKENKNPEGMIKTDIKTEKKAYVYRFPRKLKVKVLSITAALGLTLSATFGLAACDFTKPNTPVDPEKPNPIQPVDPEKPGPEKPDDPTTPVDPEEPDDPTKPVDPEKPDPDNPTPDNPDPDKPDVDYDKLTPETLTAEQKATMVKNVTTALEKQIKNNIGRVDGVVNKIIAMDFDENNVSLLLDYTNSTYGNMIGLFKYTMTTEMNYKNLLTTTVAPQSNSTASKGTTLIQFSTKTSDERTEEAIAKLKADDILDYDENITPDFIASAKGSSGVDTELKCGATFVSIYRIDKNKIINYNTRVKSDGATVDFYGDYLLNGTLGTSYRVNDSFEYSFSEKAIYNYQGLEKEITDKKVSTSYNFTVDNQTSQYIKNGKYFILEEENQN